MSKQLRIYANSKKVRLIYLLDPPLLQPQQMAEFVMRKSHLLAYRQKCLAHIEAVNGKEYADEVKKFCTDIFNKRKK